MGNEGSWTIKSKEVINRVIEENREKPVSEIKKAIQSAYPFGARKNHPYKMWLKVQKLAIAELNKLTDQSTKEIKRKCK